MKKQKNNNNKLFWILIISLIVLLILVVIALNHFLIKDQDETITPSNNSDNTIRLLINDAHFANVYVINGDLDVDIADKGAYAEIEILRTSIIEINQKETLPLTFEPELGLIQVAEIPKKDSNYIYAVAEYLREKGFDTKTTYSEYNPQPGKLSWFECTDMYDEIDSDLQNANYCSSNSDCETLPLAGPYIEFGCYHYINIKENSTDFYQRMNYYSAECGNVIDMCRMSPEPRCSEGKCIEAELS